MTNQSMLNASRSTKENTTPQAQLLMFNYGEKKCFIGQCCIPTTKKENLMFTVNSKDFTVITVYFI